MIRPYAWFGSLALLIFSPLCLAEKDIPAGTVLQNISLPAMASESPDANAPDNALARQLDDWGVYPSLKLQESAFTSHSLGLETGKTELISSWSIGADLNLGKLIGLEGGSLHFETVRNYGRKNNAVGGSVGAYPLAQIPQNAPKRDVPVFTYEQRLLDNRLEVEVGRKNVVWFFLDEYSSWQNFSRLNQYTWLVLPPPYATWSARAKYRFAPNWYVQAGAWEYNVARWGQDGWNWRTGDSSGVTTLATIGYGNNFRNARLPGHLELTGYHINAPEADPYYDETHKGANGFTLSGGKVLMRFDDGYGSSPGALYLFGSFGMNQSTWINSGVTGDSYAGISWLNPFDRPGDTIGIKAEWTRLSARKQKALEAANLTAGGDGYHSPRDTQFVQLFGHFNLSRSLSLDPFVAYGINANTAFNPVTSETPQDGWAAGLVFTFNLGDALGLPAPRL